VTFSRVIEVKQVPLRDVSAGGWTIRRAAYD
jgi:hypothetical protein